jgi:uncharacterized FAD-dependent dehydrogenase
VPLLIRNFALDFTTGEDTLLENPLRCLPIRPDEVTGWRLIRKALDARKKTSIRYVYTIELTVRNEAACLERLKHNPDVTTVEKEEPKPFPRTAAGKRIAIVGMGPAGLFAALRLSEYGLRADIYERGLPVEERVRSVEQLWSKGELDGESNVQFGEGGAGTFSDGKLTTRIRDENLGYVLRKLVRFGAPDEILYLAKPHIGTDRLRVVIRAIRNELLSRGFHIGFSRRLTDIISRNGRVSRLVLNSLEEVECDYLILATGHSSRDTYEMLEKRSICLEQKPFAIGVRVEHPQELINTIQYGISHHRSLPPAEYSLAFRDPETNRAVYSFCMCPGGVVMAATSEEGCVVTNGMSLYARGSGSANSALVVSVDAEDYPGAHPCAGIDFQREWERKAFIIGGGKYRAPAQNMLDFASGKGARGVASSYRPGVVESDLGEVLPEEIIKALRTGVRAFDRKMRGFLTSDATLIGVESRTSSPVRITRGDDFQSRSLPGLFPTGEGAGYAGGIMSAAVDGIRVADRIALEMSEETRSCV